MIKKIAVAASIGAILTTNGYAGAMGPLMDGAEKWTPVISISGGPAWTSNSHTQTIQLTTDTENSYVGVNETKALASGELFFGMQRPIQQLLLWQMGVALGAASNATLRGDIWEDASPDFNNFTYTYQIHHYHVDAKTKLILNRWNIVQPYVSGSVGVGFNRSESFNSVSKMMEETPALPFASSTNTSFTYTVGIGVQRSLTPNWHVNAGYEFSDWGSSNLSRASWQTLNGGLSLNHLYTNALQLGITYTV